MQMLERALRVVQDEARRHAAQVRRDSLRLFDTAAAELLAEYAAATWTRKRLQSMKDAMEVPHADQHP